MSILDEKRLLSMTNSMDTRELHTVSEVDQMKQGNFHKTSDLETAKRFGDTDTSTRESQHPSICKCQYSGLENIVFVRGSGPHKFHYSDHPGQPVKEIIVSRKCAEAVLRGAQVDKNNG